MKYATFNVLADAYTSYGDYSHADPELMKQGGRLEYLSQQINNLDADVIGLQEAEKSIVEVFENDNNWQLFWTPKGRNKPDGCLTLVNNEVEVSDHESRTYDDGSGHVYQLMRVGGVAIANTHIKWAPEDETSHIGARQTQELLTALKDHPSAVILADCNGRPGGQVRTMVDKAGFTNLSGEKPTAIVNGELLALDLLAVRGMKGRLISQDYDLASIPNKTCASDHIPLVAEATSM